MNLSQNRLVLFVALLLITSAALFAVGKAIEHSQRGQHHDQHGEAAATSGETQAEKTAKGESSGEGETTHTESVSEQDSEKIAGIDPESWPPVALAIASSFVLAGAVYWRRSRVWLGAAAAFGILFAAGDVREVVHQIDESREAVAAIAGVLIILHLLVTTAALATLIKSRAEISDSMAVS